MAVLIWFILTSNICLTLSAVDVFRHHDHEPNPSQERLEKIKEKHNAGHGNGTD